MQFKSSSSMTTKQRAALRMCVGVMALLILTNCSKTTLSSDAECKLFQPIYDSDRDTQQTRIEIRIHNDIGMNVCGWKPNK